MCVETGSFANHTIALVELPSWRFRVNGACPGTYRLGHGRTLGACRAAMIWKANASGKQPHKNKGEYYFGGDATGQVG